MPARAPKIRRSQEERSAETRGRIRCDMTPDVKGDNPEDGEPDGEGNRAVTDINDGAHLQSLVRWVP